MVRPRREDLFQYLAGLHRSRIALISWKDGNGLIDRERIKERALVVIRVAPMQLLHRFLIGQHSRRIGTLLPILIVGVHGRDVIALARRPSARRLCLFDGLLAALQRRSVRSANERIRARAHRDSPVPHCAVRVLGRELGNASRPWGNQKLCSMARARSNCRWASPLHETGK